MATNRICSVNGCGKPAYCRQLCKPHWKQCDTPRPRRETNFEWLLRVALSHGGTDCLFWPFARTSTGRAEVWHAGAVKNASRLVCTMAHGAPESPDLHAAHSCGNGHLGCVNPTHLRWATALENLDDKIKHARPRQYKRQNFSDDDIRRIRADKRPSRVICTEYGVAKGTISDIRIRRTWKHVAS